MNHALSRGDGVIEIRREKPADVPAIRFVHERAFGQPQEGNVVDRLRESCDGLRSLVAVEGGRVIGHILFSPAYPESLDTAASSMRPCRA